MPWLMTAEALHDQSMLMRGGTVYASGLTAPLALLLFPVMFSKFLPKIGVVVAFTVV